MDLKGMDFSKLSPELRAKAEKCKSMDELLALAKSEGLMALAVLLNFAKIKFVKGRPHNAKFYYCLCARELA